MHRGPRGPTSSSELWTAEARNRTITFIQDSKTFTLEQRPKAASLGVKHIHLAHGLGMDHAYPRAFVLFSRFFK